MKSIGGATQYKFYAKHQYITLSIHTLQRSRSRSRSLFCPLFFSLRRRSLYVLPSVAILPYTIHTNCTMSSPTSVTLNSKSASTALLVNKQLQDQQIRARLLHKLGIHGSTARSSPPSDVTSSSSRLSKPISSTSASSVVQLHQAPQTAAQLRRDRILRGMGVGYTLKTLLPDGSAVRNPLQGVKTSTEPLKATLDDHNGGFSTASSSADSHSSAANGGIKPRKTRIMFQEDVEVMPIPTRYEYSDRIKSRIWSNRHELQENAERNAVEFASEGWNWRNVTEDDGMYICSQSGELVHPIHLKHLTIDDHENDNQANHHHQDDEHSNHGAPVDVYDNNDDDEDDEHESSYNSCSLSRGKPV